MDFKIVKKIVFIAIAGLSVLGIQKFCHKKTDGFAVCKIREAFTEEKNPSQTDISLITTILNQPLTYIGKGGQCYAFATEDNQHVVKLLKYNNNYPRIWFKLFPFPLGLESYRQEKLAKKQKKLNGEYTSYKIAMEELKEETGIIYFHLDKNTLPDLKLHIKDKLNISHKLNADDYQFYIQKKGTPFYPGLERIIKEQGIETAKVAVDEMLSFLFKRCKKEIIDGDDGIWRNFAFQGTHPFQIDIGQFSYSPTLRSEIAYQNDILFFTKDFRNWLSKTNPELSAYFINSIMSITSTKEDPVKCP